MALRLLVLALLIPLGAIDAAAVLRDRESSQLASDPTQHFAEDARRADDLESQRPQLTGEQRAQAALQWIRTMRAALGAIPMDARDKEPYHSFLQRHQGEAVYSEPAGQWMLLPDTIWALHDRNLGSTAAEAVAWEAVDNGMPGECEGYPPCELATVDALDGEYLRRHPDGAHAADVVGRIRQTCDELERLLDAPNGHELFDPVSDCVDLTPKADALKSALQRSHVDASQALASLAALRTRCR